MLREFWRNYVKAIETFCRAIAAGFEDMAAGIGHFFGATRVASPRPRPEDFLIDQLRDRYVRGAFEIEVFERGVELALRRYSQA